MLLRQELNGLITMYKVTLGRWLQGELSKHMLELTHKLLEIMVWA